MNLLRNVIKSNSLLRISNANQGLPLYLSNSSRHFATETEQPTTQDSTVDQFIQNPTKGMVYGKLNGITKFTTKSDILSLLEGCELTLDDVKVDYNRSYNPMGMMIQFSSPESFAAAMRNISRKGRLFKMERANRSQWDYIAPFNGKAVLLQGIPRNALPEDVERFLSGCVYDSSSLQIFSRQAFPDPMRMALVRFPTPSEAMHAFVTKNRGFCLNNQILVRVLQ